MVRVSEEDYPSIVMASKPSPIKTKTPLMPRPEFLEPLSPNSATPTLLPPTPWDVLGMSEPDYLAMMQRVKKMYRDIDRENYQNMLLQEMNSPSYWNQRIEYLEKEREFFNKKRGWSALYIACVDKIDAQIQECEEELDRIYAEEERLEVEYD